jgi:hypothetical protein
VASSVSHATPSAIELARSAATAYKAGKYKEAIAAFREANKLQPDPRLDINIGRCFEKLGQFAEALLHCKIALNARSSDASAKSAARKCVDRVQPKLTRPKLSVTSFPTNAVISIDGQTVGKTPWTGEVAPGRRQIDMELPEYRPYSRSIVTKAAGTYAVEGTLIPNSVGAMLTITSVPAGAQVALEGQSIGETPVYRMPVDVKAYMIEVSKEGFVPQMMSVALAEGTHLERTVTLIPEKGMNLAQKKKWPMWTLFGASLALAGAGGYFGIRALTHRNRAGDLATTSGSRADLGAYNDAVDTFRSSQITADLLFVGAILSATGGILVVNWP